MLGSRNGKQAATNRFNAIFKLWSFKKTNYIELPFRNDSLLNIKSTPRAYGFSTEMAMASVYRKSTVSPIFTLSRFLTESSTS